MDGYQATQCIRELEKQVDKPRNKIIALTANAFSHDRQKCLDVGMVCIVFMYYKKTKNKEKTKTKAKWWQGLTLYSPPFSFLIFVGRVY